MQKKKASPTTFYLSYLSFFIDYFIFTSLSYYLLSFFVCALKVGTKYVLFNWNRGQKKL